MTEWRKVGDDSWEWDGDFEEGKDPLPPDYTTETHLYITGDLTRPIYMYDNSYDSTDDKKR